MANNRRTRTVRTIVEDDAGQPDKEGQDLQEFVSGLQTDVLRIKIYRLERAGEVWLDTISRDEFSEEDTREHYGPGSYKVKTLRSNGTWGPSVVFRVGAGRNSPPGTAVVSFAGGSSSAVDEVKKQLELQAARNHEIHLKMLESLGKGGGGGSISEIIAAVVALKGATTPPDSTASLLDNVKKFAEISEIFKSGGEKADETPFGMLKSLLPAFLGAGKGAPPVNFPGADGGESAAFAAARPAIPRPPAPAAMEALPKPEADPMAAVIEELAMKAVRGRDPELYADYCYELSEDKHPGPLEVLKMCLVSDAPTWFATLKEKYKLPDGVQAWFESFHSRIREIENDQTIQSAAGSGGN